MSTTEDALILELNDDCLWTIFSYLKLPDLLEVEIVCRRFQGIALMHYGAYRAVDFTDLANYCSNHSRSSQEIIEARTCKEPLTFLLNHFNNLQYLYFFDIDLMQFINETSKPVFKNAEIFSAIKYIEFNICSFNEKRLTNWFKKLPKLEVLKIKFPRDSLTGECFAELTGIKELAILFCGKMNKDLFRKFCEMNPQLIKLSISIDDTDNNHVFQSIAENLKNLENLAFSRNRKPNYVILSDLTKITRLRIGLGCQFTHEMDIFFANITKKNRIECLNFHYGNGLFSGGCPEQILQHFKHLKILILNINARDDECSLSNLFNILSCSVGLEEIHLLHGIAFDMEFYPADLKILIQNFKSLKLINLRNWINFDISFLLDIEECLHNRNQTMEFIVNGTPIEKELLKEEKCEIHQGFIERMKGKVKLTIQAQRSFHEYKEWETE